MPLSGKNFADKGHSSSPPAKRSTLSAVRNTKRRRLDQTTSNFVDETAKPKEKKLKNSQKFVLSCFTDIEKVPKEYKWRYKTVTTSLRAVLRRKLHKDDGLVPFRHMVAQIENDAEVYGALNSMVTLCLNAIADDFCGRPMCPLQKESARKLLFDFTFVTTLFSRLAGSGQWPKKFLNSDMELCKYVEEEYLTAFPTNAVLCKKFRDGTTKSIDKYLAKTIVTATKRHVKDSVSRLLKKVVKFQLEKEIHANAPEYDGNISKLASKLYYSIVWDDDEDSTEKKAHLLTDAIDGLKLCIENVYDLYRLQYSSLRNKHYHIRAKLLHDLRFEIGNLHDEFEVPKEHQIRLPTLLPVFQLKSTFVTYHALNISNLHNYAYERYLEYDVKKNNGMEPKHSIRTLVSKGKLPKRDELDFFYRVFDLYGVSNSDDTKAELLKENEINRAKQSTKNAGREQKRKNYENVHRNGSVFKGKRKTLRNLRALKQLGIRDLYSHRHIFDHPSEKPANAKSPYYVTSISSNGLEVKVTLVTLESKAEGGNGGPKNAENQRLPEGTEGLVKKNYDGVTGVLDLNVHRQGVFKTSKEHDANAVDHIGIGVDPGRIEVFTRVRARMTGANPEEAFSKTDLIQSQVKYSGQRYKALSLRANAERLEKRRRRVNKRYGDAMKELGKTTLRTPNSSFHYLTTWYELFPVLRDELLCQPRRLRRFARFRARQRCLAHMAQEVLYGSELREFRFAKRLLLDQYKNESRVDQLTTGMFKQRMKELKKSWQEEKKKKKRVVFFGASKFTHGRPCPVPRKDLIRELSLRCPVLLVNEFRTSKTCYHCGAFADMDTMDPRRRTLQCTNATCNVDRFNRDYGASANMARCGACMIQGKPRPGRLNKAYNAPNPLEQQQQQE